MAGRRTNLGLLVLVPAALGTGGLAFALGTGWGRWATGAHAVAGFGVVVLTPWKSVIVRRGLRRPRRARLASLALGALVVVALVSGLAHSTGLATTAGPVSAMQVHVAAALLAVPFFAAHLVTRRQPVQRTDLSRRHLLRLGVLAAASTVAYAAVEATARLGGLPGGRRRFTGSLPRAPFEPADLPVTQWLDDRVQEIDAARWRLRVSSDGRTREWTYAELLGFDDRMAATLDCTGGWSSRQEWRGVLLSRLVPPHAEARSLTVRSRTGYTRRFPLRDAPHLLVATHLGDVPLTAGHGFPARLVAPGRRGFWWVKWLDSVEAGPRPWWAQLPFPAS